ncbi:MAG: beta-lactamase family protein, partial [Glaciimonas sp.]|nr:beta-lactamase family protein [Glaciimonas sp.]
MKFNQIPDFFMAGRRAAAAYVVRFSAFIAWTLLIAAPGSNVWSDTLPTDFSRLDTYIQSQLESASIPGATLVVVSKDKVLHMRGFGIRGPDGNPPTSQTLFMLGSTSKSFTALAIMQLVEAGKIGLDLPVKTYLPWFQVADPVASGRITVRQLLNQNSGFSTLDGRKNFANTDRSDTALELNVRELKNVKLQSAPGTHWEYSNINYVILGYLVQAISGEPYDRYIERNVFGPLGMKNSSASDKLGRTADLATGYRYWFGKAKPAYELPYPTSQVSAGYLFTNAEDMGRYLMAHLNGGVVEGVSVISSSGIDTLHLSGVPIFGNDRYAMGWFFNSSTPTFFDHNGGLPNFFSQMAIDTKEGWGVAL